MTLNKKQPKGLAAMQRATPHGNEPQVPPSAAVAPEQEVQPRMDFPNQPAPDKRESKKRARAEEQGSDEDVDEDWGEEGEAYGEWEEGEEARTAK